MADLRLVVLRDQLFVGQFSGARAYVLTEAAHVRPCPSWAVARRGALPVALEIARRPYSDLENVIFVEPVTNLCWWDERTILLKLHDQKGWQRRLQNH